jgi:hypothetical protein
MTVLARPSVVGFLPDSHNFSKGIFLPFFFFFVLFLFKEVQHLEAMPKKKKKLVQLFFISHGTFNNKSKGEQVAARWRV